jgi:hypothetical protein
MDANTAAVNILEPTGAVLELTQELLIRAAVKEIM